MKIFRKVALVALALIAGCSPKPLHERDPFGLQQTPTAREAAATVVILNPDNYGGQCSGVSVNDGSVTRILTAAHCVTHLDNPFDIGPWPVKIANLGDVVYFVPKNGSRPSCSGTVAMFNPDRDLAYVDADDPGDLPSPLSVKPMCTRCTLTDTDVHAVSALYGWVTHSGYVIGQTVDGNAKYWASSISIRLGWSGSPVISSDGVVVGVIAKCITHEDRGQKECDSGYSVFSGIQ